MVFKEQVLELAEKGLYSTDIAVRLGCTSAYVRATLQRRDYPERARQYRKNQKRRQNETVA